MLNACMIDGFGWFPRARYRRTILLFDRIDYVFPNLVEGVMAPPLVYRRPDFKPVHPRASAETIHERVLRASKDSEDPQFRALVLKEVPQDDLEYSSNLLTWDEELRDLGIPSKTAGNAIDPVFAVSYFADKLLDYGDQTGMVPIVGQDHAVRVLAAKIRRRAGLRTLSSDAMLTSGHGASLHALAAGLSMAFVTDDALVATPLEALVAFKTDNKRLLDRHHLHLIETAQSFANLPDDPSFPEALAALRADAARKRLEMEVEAQDAWLTAGFELVEKGLVAGSGGVATAIGLLSTGSIADLAVKAAPAVAVGVAIAVGQAIKALYEARKSRGMYVSYLLDASRYLEQR